MEKKTRLLNIYLKIHQKRDLTWEDLEYLARFDPECFEKTCKNVVYNIPQTKNVILQKEGKEDKKLLSQTTESKREKNGFSIEQTLKNLKQMEMKQNPFAEFDVDRVKNLLGNLYMELLFPHNDQDSFFSAAEEDRGSRFDRKA